MHELDVCALTNALADLGTKLKTPVRDRAGSPFAPCSADDVRFVVSTSPVSSVALCGGPFHTFAFIDSVTPWTLSVWVEVRGEDSTESPAVREKAFELSLPLRKLGFVCTEAETGALDGQSHALDIWSREYDNVQDVAAEIVLLLALPSHYDPLVQKARLRYLHRPVAALASELVESVSVSLSAEGRLHLRQSARLLSVLEGRVEPDWLDDLVQVLMGVARAEYGKQRAPGPAVSKMPGVALSVEEAVERLLQLGRGELSWRAFSGQLEGWKLAAAAWELCRPKDMPMWGDIVDWLEAPVSGGDLGLPPSLNGARPDLRLRLVDAWRASSIATVDDIYFDRMDATV